MKQLPKGYPLLGRDWAIKYNKDPDCEEYGECAGEQLSILANPLKGFLRYNLWHEFNHSLLYATGLNRILAQHGPELEEAVVRAYEYALDDIIAFIAEIQDIQ